MKRDKEKVIAQVTGGVIKGSINEYGVKIFKGIPFAASTEGKNRFRAPQAVEKWEGIRDCTEYGPIAMQNPPKTFGPWTEEYVDAGKTYENGKMSEDCLSLNIWTAAKTGDRQPVIVYIHGGGNQSGSGACEIYTGENIAKRKVVYVSINYRVGLFGFLAYKDSTGDEVRGNLAIQDQIAALKWVKTNISEFGGNPDNVTIMGQSAGSQNCQMLLISPAARGLFEKVFCMSFPPETVLPVPLAYAEAEAREKLGEITLEKLRSMDSEEVQKLAAVYNPHKPCLDNEILVQTMSEAFASGNYNKADMIWGGVPGDCGLFGILQVLNKEDDWSKYTVDEYKEILQSVLGEKVENCLQCYGSVNTGEEISAQVNAINKDELLARYYNASVQKNRTDPEHKTYVYTFSHVVPDTPKRMEKNGSFHTGDVGYWLNYFTNTYTRPWKMEDYDLGEKMCSYLVHFAFSGDPNGLDPIGNPLPGWRDVEQTDTISCIDLDEEIKWKSMEECRSQLWSR